MRSLTFAAIVLTLVASAALAQAQTATITGQWTAAPNADAHKVMKRVGTGAYSLFTTVAMPATTFTDAGNPLGQMYCYQVVGTNSSGDGPASQEQCVTPLVVPGNVTNFSLSVTIVP